MAFCANCGSHAGNSVFCSNCGSFVNAAGTTWSPPPPRANSTTQLVTKTLIAAALREHYGVVPDELATTSAISFSSGLSLGNLYASFDPNQSGSSLRCKAIYELPLPHPKVAQAIYLCNKFNSAPNRINASVDVNCSAFGRLSLTTTADLLGFVCQELLLRTIISFEHGIADFEEWMLSDGRYGF